MRHEKKRRLFSGFDVAVVLLVTLAVLVWIFIINRTPEVEVTMGDEATFHLEVTNLTVHQIADVQVGDRLLEGTQHMPIGEVVGIRVEPHLLRVDDRTNLAINWVPMPGRYVMILSVSTAVVHTERDILAEGQVAIRGGAPLHFTGPGYAFANAVILGWEREGAAA